jgi:hypothetical protein
MTKKSKTRSISKVENKPILQFSVLCDGVAKGQAGKPVFVGVFDNFVRTGVIAQFFIVNRWIYGKGKFKQKIDIKDPDLKKNVVEIPDQEFYLLNETSPANVITALVNAKFEKPGVYWVEVYLNNELMMSYPLPVHEQKG